MHYFPYRRDVWNVPKIKLTAAGVKALPAPDPSGKTRLYWDTAIKGFGVLVSAKTTGKSFIVQRDLDRGKSRRITLGPVGLISFEEARKLATEQLLIMRSGVDPVVEEKKREAEARQLVTLAQAEDAFFQSRRI